MLFSFLKKINLKGKIDIIDSKGITHSFGKKNPYVKIVLKNMVQEKFLILKNMKQFL